MLNIKETPEYGTYIRLLENSWTFREMQSKEVRDIEYGLNILAVMNADLITQRAYVLHSLFGIAEVAADYIRGSFHSPSDERSPEVAGLAQAAADHAARFAISFEHLDDSWQPEPHEDPRVNQILRAYMFQGQTLHFEVPGERFKTPLTSPGQEYYFKWLGALRPE